DQRPRRQQEDGFLALPVHLVEELTPVALDKALDIRIAGAALLAVAADRLLGGLPRVSGLQDRLHGFPCSRSVSQPSIAASSSACPRSKPRRRSFSRPLLNCMTSGARASAQKRELPRPYSSIACASASRSSERQLSLTACSRSRISGL